MSTVPWCLVCGDSLGVSECTTIYYFINPILWSSGKNMQKNGSAVTGVCIVVSRGIFECGIGH